MMCATPDCGRAVMNIVVWLRSLGLGKYEAAFRENEIDETVLPSLTHETLKELGVTALSTTSGAFVCLNGLSFVRLLSLLLRMRRLRRRKQLPQND